jgi:hypothetical protein
MLLMRIIVYYDQISVIPLNVKPHYFWFNFKPKEQQQELANKLLAIFNQDDSKIYTDQNNHPVHPSLSTNLSKLIFDIQHVHLGTQAITIYKFNLVIFILIIKIIIDILSFELQIVVHFYLSKKIFQCMLFDSNKRKLIELTQVSSSRSLIRLKKKRKTLKRQLK